MIRRFGVALLASCAAIVACSSNDGGGGTTETDAGSSRDGGGDASSAGDDAATGDAAAPNCVPEGYKGNSKGVGAYCSADVGCPFKVGGTLLICTAGHTSHADKIFCTTPCTEDSDCGEQAFCGHDPAGSGCVPFACGDPPDASAHD